MSATGARRRVAMLVNPAAGGSRGTDLAATAARRLLARGAEVELIAAQDVGAARDQARRCVADGVDVLAVVGGDGMVHLALQALAPAGGAVGPGTPATAGAPALAVVPAGTGNDFARVLGIPRRDAEAAADLVLDGEERTLDLGRVTGDGTPPRWFGTVLTSGFDALVTDRANRMRRPRGRMRYNLAMVAELGLLRPLPFVLDVDGARHELEATLIAVGNTTTYGGGMRICPHAAPDDGRLAVTVVPAVGRAELLRVFPRVYRGTHVSHPGVRTFTGRRVRVETADMRAYADGEPLGALPLEAEAVSAAVGVLVPPHRRRAARA
ncbi:diacylglycerol kinase [Streptomyces sp. DSM 42041]|uniref:Diacylglycerol kinase n=1 Tax=Streptomyces hazeniae TaxID=3075538 RepID=A0ABU2NXQ5_9ACTN|nr:diacylglycerol kinase [Streptomyces sp. DSM 42041]MDT0381777.1 diacylglycerol kinase [Streptomyces sp. DSM 42041]